MIINFSLDLTPGVQKICSTNYPTINMKNIEESTAAGNDESMISTVSKLRFFKECMHKHNWTTSR